MGGPGSGRRRKPAKAQPRGTRWLTARAACFQLYGDTCHVCGHPGATEADHLVPTDDPMRYLDVANLRPAHGTRHRCETCGKACNQSRGGAKRIAARANGNGTQNGPRKTPITTIQVQALHQQLAAITHHQDCACRGRVAPKTAIFHHPSCACSQIYAQAGVIASRCW